MSFGPDESYFCILCISLHYPPLREGVNNPTPVQQKLFFCGHRKKIDSELSNTYDYERNIQNSLKSFQIFFFTFHSAAFFPLEKNF